MINGRPTRDPGRWISDNFGTHEVQCKCGECSGSTADIELVWILEQMRGYFGSRRVHINSWFRCRDHNNRSKTECNANGHYGAGSNDRSWHLIGGAVDFKIPSIDCNTIRDYVRGIYTTRLGLGIYDWGVHLDVRPDRVDWDERS